MQKNLHSYEQQCRERRKAVNTSSALQYMVMMRKQEEKMMIMTAMVGTHQERKSFETLIHSYHGMIWLSKYDQSQLCDSPFFPSKSASSWKDYAKRRELLSVSQDCRSLAGDEDPDPWFKRWWIRASRQKKMQQHQTYDEISWLSFDPIILWSPGI